MMPSIRHTAGRVNSAGLTSAGSTPEDQSSEWGDIRIVPDPDPELVTVLRSEYKLDDDDSLHYQRYLADWNLRCAVHEVQDAMTAESLLLSVSKIAAIDEELAWREQRSLHLEPFTFGIPRQVIDDLKSRADIVREVERYSPTRRAGRDRWVCRCPFPDHEDTTPSFSISHERGLWHCFGCGRGGDVIHLVMNLEALSFPEAVEILADRYSMQMPERSYPQSYKPSAGAPDSCDDRVRDLEEANARLRDKVRRLTEENRRILDDRRLMLGVLRNRHLSAGEAMTALAVVFDLESGERRGVDEDGFVRVNLGALADNAGSSKPTVSRHVRKLEEWNIVERVVIQHPPGSVDQQTGEIREDFRSELRLRLVDDPRATLSHLVEIEPVRNNAGHGGRRERRCPESTCESEEIVTLEACAGCGTVVTPEYAGARVEFHHETGGTHQRKTTAPTHPLLIGTLDDQDEIRVPRKAPPVPGHFGAIAAGGGG